jgi:hypothetical protein
MGGTNAQRGWDQLLGVGASASVSLDRTPAGAFRTYTFRIRLGRGGLPAGDSIGLVCGSNVDRWQFHFASHIWGSYIPWQVRDPAAAGYVTARSSRPAAALTLAVGCSGGLKMFANRRDYLVRSLRVRQRFVLELRADRPLYCGDTLEITWGDTRWGGPGVAAPALALPYYFMVFRFSRLPEMDRDLPLKHGNWEAHPCIRVTGGPAERLHAAFAPVVGRGEAIRLACAAVDRYGNLDESFAGLVRARVSDPRTRAPAAVRFRAGRAEIRGLRFRTPGWHTLTLEGAGLFSPSYPIRVEAERPDDRIYFGEMHGHTLDCDATFPAAEHFRYARQVAGLDFCALGSHVEYFGTAEAWRRYLAEATRAHAPGRFITFYGYEWAVQGHTNAYFMREQDVAAVYGSRLLRGRHPLDEPPFRTPANRETVFLRRLRRSGRPVLAIAHFHTCYADPVDTSVLRLHEVYSMHQQNPRDTTLQAVLGRNIRVGVVAGSDSHRLPSGSLCPDPDRLWRQALVVDGAPASGSIQKKPGLQAVMAPALERQTLWDAMRARRTYGTTGARMILFFTVNGEPMGRELKTDGRGCLDIRLKAAGTAPFTEARVFRFDGWRWCTAALRKQPGRVVELRFQDRPPRAWAVYYARVIQSDGETGWTSPIWVDRSAGGGSRP